MKVKYSIAALLGIIGLCWSCSSPEQDRAYRMPEGYSRGARAEWFGNYENHSVPGFSDSLDHYIATKMAKGEVDSAAHAVLASLRGILMMSVVDTSILMRSKRFLWQHRDRIPPNMVGNFHLNIGSSLMQNQQIDSGGYYFRTGRVEEYDFFSARSNAVLDNQLAMFLMLHTNQLDSAFQLAVSSLAVCERIDYIKGQADAISTLANVSQYTANGRQLLYYRRKAIELSRKTDDYQGVLLGYFNLYTDFHAIDDQAGAQGVIDTLSMLFAEKRSENQEQCFTFECLLATQRLTLNDPLGAQFHLDRADSVGQNMNEMQRNLEIYTIPRVSVQVALGQPTLTYAEFDSMLNQQLAYGQFTYAENLAGVLRDAALKKDDLRDALRYGNLASMASDSVRNLKAMNRISELRELYEVEKKEHTIALQHETIARSRSTNVALGFGMTTLAVSGLLFFVQRRRKEAMREAKQRKEFTSELLRNTEIERKRIANDLHDGVGHELLSLKAGIESGREDLSFRVESILNDVRGISRNLHPVLFEKVGLQHSVQQLCERIAQQHNFMISNELEYTGGLSTDAELQVYRIIQEALSNVIKYAKAHAAKVSMTIANGLLTVEVRDNGKGFDVAASMSGAKAFGLHSMVERASAIGGKAVLSSSAKGTVVVVTVPISA
ncbi:MAG: sensor histidine kinase [Flavobacteriales bacterium]|nr:sensor histidine kinase [Flavobacteriales bacterium]